MDTFYVSFRHDDPRSRGYVRVEANTRDEATVFAMRTYGSSWAWVDQALDFVPELFPHGELGAYRIEPRT